MNALLNAANVLRSWPGVRKSVLLISPGSRAASLEALDAVQEGDKLREVFVALQEANINVYQYDPRGLEVETVLTDFGTFADATGGRAVTNTSAPDALVPQMFRENSSYYLLGVPLPTSRDGRFRHLEVRVNRPDVEVRARSGYYGPSNRPAVRSGPPLSDVDRALSGGLPAGDVPLSLAVAPLAAPGRSGAAIGVFAGVDRDSGLEAGGPVELVAVAFDERWRQVATVKERFHLPSEDGLGPRSGLEMAARLNVPPGRYEVRVALTSPSTTRTGSVYASVTVPDFARERLSLAGILLARDGGGAAMSEAVASLVSVRPTTDRAFTSGERVEATMRVHQGGRQPLEPVRVEARFVDKDDRVTIAETVTFDAAVFGNQRQADYRLALPLERITAGEHLLTVEVSTVGATPRRDVRFSVRP